MVNRLMALLGMTVVIVAIAAALLAGAATAVAETGTESGATDTKSSESSQQSSPKTEPATTTTSGQATSHKPDSDSEESGQKPTGSPTVDPSADKDADDTEIAPPTSSQQKPGGSSVDPKDDARPASKSNKPHLDEPKPGLHDAGGAADTAESPEPESHATSQPDPPSVVQPTVSVAADHTAQPAVDTTTASTVTMSARATAAVTEEAAAPRTPTLIDVVGSIVLNLVVGLIHVFDGPPVLPPGSNVTVRTSTLTVGGQTVEADWYFPKDGQTPTRLIYLQHGFFASGPMYSYTAATLAEQTHSIVVAPSLSSNWFDADGAWLGGAPMQQAVADLFVGDRSALTESASVAAGYDVTLPDRFVLAGHSLGGTLVMGAAGYMVDNGAVDDLAGILLLDSVDMNNAVPAALQKLTGTNYRPVLNISSERYVWNMDGLVDDELESARPGEFNGVMLVGGRHIDALQGGNPLIQFSEYLVAGFSQPQNIEAVKTLAVGWVNDMFAGTHDGIYGAPQEAIQIPTTAGTATAVVLPLTSSEPVQGTLFDWLFRLILPFVGQESVAAEPLTV
jgi:pimeloyl-ACP methyl ester carboxylesterase